VLAVPRSTAMSRAGENVVRRLIPVRRLISVPNSR
jgi:hypothetical protein